jgi:hypothetical protein
MSYGTGTLSRRSQAGTLPAAALSMSPSISQLPQGRSIVAAQSQRRGAHRPRRFRPQHVRPVSDRPPRPPVVSYAFAGTCIGEDGGKK